MSMVGIELPMSKGYGIASMSAPSSPGRFSSGFFFSTSGSPSRHITDEKATQMASEEGADLSDYSSEFEFGALCIDVEEPVVTADELFCNGQIRPMRPSLPRPLIDLEDESHTSNGVEGSRGRGLQKEGSQRRRTRSLSPLRSPFLQEKPENSKSEDIEEHKSQNIGAACCKKGRSGSKRWISLKDFLYRSKSEGSGQTQHKHWALSFSSSPTKQQQQQQSCSKKQQHEGSSTRQAEKSKTKTKIVSDLNSGNQGKRNSKVPISAHELLYTAKRAQAEEQRHKTYLPYRQGLFGFVGFTSKS